MMSKIAVARPLLPCEFCKRTYTNQAGLNEHKGFFHEGIRYACAHCSLYCGRRQELRSHKSAKICGTEESERPLRIKFNGMPPKVDPEVPIYLNERPVDWVQLGFVRKLDWLPAERVANDDNHISGVLPNATGTSSYMDFKAQIGSSSSMDVGEYCLFGSDSEKCKNVKTCGLSDDAKSFVKERKEEIEKRVTNKRCRDESKHDVGSNVRRMERCSNGG